MIQYLSFQEIADANRKAILKSENNVTNTSNIINHSSLEYLINIVKEKINDTELYPTLPLKAAVYAFNIITRHIFIDGNKRTGMACAFQFLELNDYSISDSIPTDEIVDIALKVAKNNANLTDLANWIESIIEPTNS